MKKIIFVCLGNICRSSMAEMMMKNLVDQAGLKQEIEVCSRATSTYNIGDPPHPGAISELKKRNIPIISHFAKKITTNDFETADFIIGMDKQNVADLKRLSPNDDQMKIKLMYSILNQETEIEDPWYDHRFDRTYKQLEKALPVWLNKLSLKD